MKDKFKYIYGPVSSWRLGRSLGIDPISQKEKQCVFDCCYCQIGRAKAISLNRKVFVKEGEIIKEISLLKKNAKIDYITFSGSGEPTLAKNLGVLIKRIKKIRSEPVAVITNSAVLHRSDVVKDLKEADLVMAKLDAAHSSVFKKVNCPYNSINFSKLVLNLKKFRKTYNKTLALQIMFVKDNIKDAEAIADISSKIKADIIFINTPLRPSGVRPLTKIQMKKIKSIFVKKGLEVISVFDKKRKKAKPFNIKETLKRRGSKN